MSFQSKIEWTEATWNPVTGCSKISAGCKNCYAERLANRLKAMGNPSYRNGFQVTIQERALELPLKWKRPMIILANSMSDLLHEEVPLEFIKRVFEVMKLANQHIFQVLTKRSERLKEIFSQINCAENIWMGVSVENELYQKRIDHLRQVNSNVKFISIEPLIGPIHNLNLEGIDWVIVGGESGPNARIMKMEWVIEIRDQCLKANVPFFFKQWGGINKKKSGRILEGKTWDGFPKTIKADNKSKWEKIQDKLF